MCVTAKKRKAREQVTTQIKEKCRDQLMEDYISVMLIENEYNLNLVC
jgi:hypothetical protein